MQLRARITSSGPNRSDSPKGSIGEEETALDEGASGAGTAPTALDGASSASRSASGSPGPRQTVAQVGMMLGRYELTGELGEGGMASVFAARDTKLGREVAVKVMFPHLARRKEAASRFKREARAAAGLDHKHILRVFDVGGGEVEENVLIPPYIVMERIDGSSLDDFFREHEPPLAEVVAAIGVALCRGLAQAHEKDIVHRDIKPANVMVTQEGRLVLADFGVARVGDDDSVVTKTGAVLGTPAYMSPEQASGEKVDSRSDLYSLGATLYRIATGSVPYGGTAAQVIANIIEGKRIPADRRDPKIGRELSRVIDKLMETDPQMRFSDAAEAERALLDIVEGGGELDWEKLLADYVVDPEGQEERTRERVVSASLARARTLSMKGRAPAALAIAERVLALSPGHPQAQVLCDTLGRRKRDKRLLLAIFGPMVVTAIVGAVFWTSRPGPIASYADAAPSDAWVPPSDAAAETKSLPVLESVDAGESIRDAGLPDSAGEKVSRRPRAKPRDPDAAVAAALPPTLDASVPTITPEPEPPARLIVNILPWCDVWIDGEKRERASKSKSYKLAPGTHDIECKQQSTGMQWSKTVTLVAGETRTLQGSVLAPTTIAVRLSNGDSVTVGKTRIANGESEVIPAGRHRVQVFKAGKPEGPARSIDFVTSCIMRDEPKLMCSSR